MSKQIQKNPKPEKPFTTPPITAICFWCVVFGGLIALLCAKLDHR